MNDLSKKFTKREIIEKKKALSTELNFVRYVRQKRNYALVLHLRPTVYLVTATHKMVYWNGLLWMVI